MDAILAVEKEIDRVMHKFGKLNDHYTNILQEMTLQLEQLKQDMLLQGPEAEISNLQSTLLQGIIKKIRDVTGQMTIEHRDLHGAVSRVGKAIDKNFTADFSEMANEALWTDGNRLRVLNESIVEHFLRIGQMELAELLTKEGNLNIPLEKKNPFLELNTILEQLKRHDISGALAWAKENREALKEEQDSSLEFKLHRLQFIEYLKEGKSRESDLISYARTHLQPLSFRFPTEVQILMGSLMFLKSGLENSAYKIFLDPINWDEIGEVFIRDACSILGLSVESPLAVAFDAGCVALPALLNIRQMMQKRQLQVSTSKDELPIEIDIGRKKPYHSIFACPVFRQQSADPMRLVCGHVISKDALHKLSNGNKLKCPYCPIEQNPGEARLLYF